MAESTSAYLTNKLRRLAWSKRVSLALATAAVDLDYLLSRASTGRRTTARPEAVAAAGDDAADLGRLDRYTSEFATIGGSFWHGGIVTWDILLARQAKRAVRGDLLEIGVLKGKSAALIALHARAGETFAMVDRPCGAKQSTRPRASVRPTTFSSVTCRRTSAPRGARQSPGILPLDPHRRRA